VFVKRGFEAAERRLPSDFGFVFFEDLKAVLDHHLDGFFAEIVHFVGFRRVGLAPFTPRINANLQTNNYLSEFPGNM
jgi:hypothetical protein